MCNRWGRWGRQWARVLVVVAGREGSKEQQVGEGGRQAVARTRMHRRKKKGKGKEGKRKRNHARCTAT